MSDEGTHGARDGGADRLAVGGIAILLRECRRAVRSKEAGPVAVLIAVGLVGGVVTAAEISLRLAAEQRPWGEEIAGTLLLPRGWDHVVSMYSAMLDRFESAPNYFVEDTLLGWKIGPNRTGQGGLWLSGPEGARTPRQGYSYAESDTSCRVILMGDSFTFGEEESFEQTLGARLQHHLGSACQVLNIAVPGYSLAQMYLAARRDLPVLKPTAVVLGFSDGAPARGLGVYCFLSMIDWDCPWAAPRFILSQGRLELVNVPLPSPREIYRHRAIYELPFIRYDRSYWSSEWEHPGWEPLYWSYLFRLAATKFRPYDQPQREVSEEALWEVNAAIMREFVSQMARVETPLVILYQAQISDFVPDQHLPYTPGFLRRLGLDFVDGVTCLEGLPFERRFRPGGTHYSDEGESALAACLLPKLNPYLKAQVEGDSRSRSQIGSGSA